MDTLTDFTTWEEFHNWTKKYGWIRLSFKLRGDKTGLAKFVLPSGKFAEVELADDASHRFVVMDCRVTGS